MLQISGFDFQFHLNDQLEIVSVSYFDGASRRADDSDRHLVHAFKRRICTLRTGNLQSRQLLNTALTASIKCRSIAMRAGTSTISTTKNCITHAKHLVVFRERTAVANLTIIIGP